MHEDQDVCVIQVATKRQALLISRDTKLHFLHKVFIGLRKITLSDLPLGSSNSVKLLSVADGNSWLTSRLNWKFHYQLVCTGVESGCCLFRINFLRQFNIEFVQSWNIQ